MSIVKNIRENVTSRVQATLGSGFSKLSHASEVSLNKFGTASKRFAVSPENAFEVSGSTSLNTLDHRFIVTLTDGFANGTMSQVNDDLKMERIAELQDQALLIYKDLQTYKSLVSASVLIINGLSISAIEFLDEERVAVLKFEFNVRYKI
jgi:hypothetical protein